MAGDRDLRHYLGRMLLAAHIAAAVVAASLCVAGYLFPDLLGAFDRINGWLTLSLRGSALAHVAFLFAVALLLADVLWFLYGRHPQAPPRHVLSDRGDGPVLIAREAIEASLRAAGEAVDGITRLRVSLAQPAAKRLLVHAQFTAPEGARIQDASQALRRALATRFTQMVQPADGARAEFEIEFVGFAGKPRRGAPAAGTEEQPGADAAEPFTGPRYPIDDDDTWEERKRG
jgi:hypothetical protein